MAYSMFDPFGIFDDPYQPVAAPPTFPAYKPDEAESMLAKYGNSLMGGVGYVGNLMDKAFGGRAVRGLLGGKGRELLSILPGSDLIGLTDENEAVSGRNLTDQWGLTNEGETGFLPTATGIAAEMLLDPTNLALMGVPAAARLPHTMLKGYNKAARAAAPFVPGGKLAVGAADKVADVGSRYGKALLQNDYMGRTTPQGQSRSLQASGDMRQQKTWLREDVIGLRNRMKERGVDPSDLMKIKEGTLSSLQPDLHNPFLEQLYGVEGIAPPTIDQWKAFKTGQMEGPLAPGLEEMLRLEGQNLGVNAATREKYWPRQRTEGFYDKKGRGGSGRAFETQPGVLSARDELLGRYPRHVLNALSTDKRFATLSPTEAAELIRREYLGLDDAELFNLKELSKDVNNPLSPTELERLGLLSQQFNDAPRLADWRRTSVSPRHAEMSIPIFGNDPIYDFLNHAEGRITANESARAALDLIADNARPLNTLPQGAKSVHDLAENKFKLGDTIFNDGSPPVGPAPYLAQKMSLDDPAKLFDLGVDPVLAADITKQRDAIRLPPALQTVLENVVDPITTLTKSFNTIVNPKHHARNRLGGLYQNIDAGIKGDTGWAKIIDKGGVPEGFAAKYPQFGATDAEAVQKFKEMAWAHDVAGGRQGQAQDILAGTLPPENALLAQLPGQDPRSTWEMAKAGITGLADPAARKPWTRAEGVNENFAPFAAGHAVSNRVETVNRLEGLLGALDKGMTFPEAAEAVGKAQYKYGNYTPFEREVMRRLVPFYAWQKNNLPAIANKLMNEPAGLTGRLTRLAPELTSGPGMFVPEYLSGGLAIPLGTEEDGNQRFLTRLGLPFEDLDILQGGPNAIQETGQRILGNLNPLLKGPLEYATGKQFFTGRDLADLHPITGNSLFDQAIMNSPASSAWTQLRTLIDPRKWESPVALPVNLLTGAKLSDVDMDRHRRLAVKEAGNKMLAGGTGARRFEKFYPDPTKLMEYTPEEIAIFRLQRTIDEMNKAEKKRAKESARK